MSGNGVSVRKYRGGRPKAGAPSKWEKEQEQHIGSSSTLRPPSQEKRRPRQSYGGLGGFKRAGWAAREQSDDLDQALELSKRFKPQNPPQEDPEPDAVAPDLSSRPTAPAARATRSPSRVASPAASAKKAVSRAARGTGGADRSSGTIQSIESAPDSEDSSSRKGPRQLSRHGELEVEDRNLGSLQPGESTPLCSPRDPEVKADSDPSKFYGTDFMLDDDRNTAVVGAMEEAGVDEEADGAEGNEADRDGSTGGAGDKEQGGVEPVKKRRNRGKKADEGDWKELKPRHLKGRKRDELVAKQRAHAEAAALRRANPPPEPDNATAELREVLLRMLRPKLRRWCMYEWFYSPVDYGWYCQNEFAKMLQDCGLGHVTHLMRVEWSFL